MTFFGNIVYLRPCSVICGPRAWWGPQIIHYYNKQSQAISICFFQRDINMFLPCNLFVLPESNENWKAFTIKKNSFFFVILDFNFFLIIVIFYNPLS